MSTRRVPRKFSAIAVGAGPVGLVAAAALAQEGHAVTVLERNAGLQTRGGMLIIQPAAVRALRHVVSEQAINKLHTPAQNFYRWSYKANEPFALTAAGVASYGSRVHPDRPSLQRLAYEAAIDAGVSVLFGQDVQRVDAVKPAVYTTDGQEFTADLIIGADGIKSRVRRLIFPNKDVEPTPIREAIFRTDVPLSSLVTDPRVSRYLEPNTIHATMGPGRFAIGRLSNHSSMHMTLIDVDHGEPGPVEGRWNIPGDLAKLRQLYSGFNEPFRAYLAHATQCERWQVALGPELDSWRSESGRVVLVGDAAHAMLPHAAQGASQGIEDGVALARLLRWAESPDDIPFIMQCFERLRRPRVEKFVHMSRDNARLHSLPDGPEQEARDEKLKNLESAQFTEESWEGVEPDMNGSQKSPGFLKWEQDYDIVAEVDKFIYNILL